MGPALHEHSRGVGVVGGPGSHAILSLCNGVRAPGVDLPRGLAGSDDVRVALDEAGQHRGAALIGHLGIRPGDPRGRRLVANVGDAVAADDDRFCPTAGIGGEDFCVAVDVGAHGEPPWHGNLVVHMTSILVFTELFAREILHRDVVR